MKCPKCLKIFHLEQMTKTGRKWYCLNCIPLIIKQQNYWKDYYRNQPDYQTKRKKRQEWNSRLKNLDPEIRRKVKWMIRNKYRKKEIAKSS